MQDSWQEPKDEVSDEEPRNIADLIEEYEKEEIINKHIERKHSTFNSCEYNGFYNANIAIWDRLEESEETEVKSKQELIEKWELAIESAEFYGKGKEEELIGYMKDFVSDLKQLDEPEVLSRELPVIPKFVADWVESRDYYNVYKVLQDLSAPGSPHASKDVRNWIFRNQKNVEKFVRAWLDGYTVEEEQKYYVVNNENELILGWSQSAYMTPCIEGYEYMKHNGRENLFQLTEQEIKDYDERCWPFAVKAEEVEDD